MSGQVIRLPRNERVAMIPSEPLKVGEEYTGTGDCETCLLIDLKRRVWMPVRRGCVEKVDNMNKQFLGLLKLTGLTNCGFCFWLS